MKTGGYPRKCTMKLKLNDQGFAVVQDGKPVYVDDGGKEIAFDYDATLGTISRLNGEAKGHRERAEKAEGDLKSFEGINDPAKALKALETIKNLDDKKLVDAGEVEKVKAEAIKAVEEKYAPVIKERDGLKCALDQEIIGGAFSRSKFIGEKLAIPADLVESKFRAAFTHENGKIVALDPNGNRIYSKSNPGELAGFDEALETLVNTYPHRDSILKGTGASGSGASGSSAGAGGQRIITRQQYDAMPAAEQRSIALGKVNIVD